MAGLKPEVSLGVGLATAAMVYATYNHALPSAADVRVAKENDPDIAGARRLAAWTSAGVVAAVSLMAKDPTVFVIGGSMVIVLDWWHRYSDQVVPQTKKAIGAGAVGVGATAAQEGAGSDSSYSYD